MMAHGPRTRALLIAAGLLCVTAGCGSTKTVTVPRPSTAAQSGSPKSPSRRSQNAQVINRAAHAGDNQAQLGAAKIRAILTRKLGLNDQESFDLTHQIAAGDNGGDCYVKLGAEAVNFESMTGNILRSPSGNDIVFVQSNTVTPLVKCLKAVNSALGW
jgi:hypothetical protein